MRTVVEDFGMAVRQLREQHGWSQEHLAALADLNRSYVGEIERGRAIASIVTVHKLASALRIEPPSLLARGAQIAHQRDRRLAGLVAMAG